MNGLCTIKVVGLIVCKIFVSRMKISATRDIKENLRASHDSGGGLKGWKIPGGMVCKQSKYNTVNIRMEG